MGNTPRLHITFKMPAVVKKTDIPEIPFNNGEKLMKLVNELMSEIMNPGITAKRLREINRQLTAINKGLRQIERTRSRPPGPKH